MYVSYWRYHYVMFSDDLLMKVYVDQRVVMREWNEKLCLRQTSVEQSVVFSRSLLPFTTRYAR